MWEWNKADAALMGSGPASERAWTPMVVHKTRRSLRAVHFHPHGAPLMLTAEVRTRPSLRLWEHANWDGAVSERGAP